MNPFQTSREIAATPEQIFAAFSDPERLARWWGPAGFTNTFKIFEFKPGGHWSFTMHGPEGHKFPNESVFAEIEAPTSLVIQHVSGPKYRLTINLSAAGERTLVSWSQHFEDDAVAQRIAHIVIPSNEQNLDRLTAEVLRPADS
ncbi:MAG TPA: SRPBCC family protein [Verrucomicrobiae bacterium]